MIGGPLDVPPPISVVEVILRRRVPEGHDNGHTKEDFQHDNKTNENMVLKESYCGLLFTVMILLPWEGEYDRLYRSLQTCYLPKIKIIYSSNKNAQVIPLISMI